MGFSKYINMMEIVPKNRFQHQNIDFEKNCDPQEKMIMDMVNNYDSITQVNIGYIR